MGASAYWDKANYIERCSVVAQKEDSAVCGQFCVGGLIGVNAHTTGDEQTSISQCSAAIDVKARNSNEASSLGGLIGELQGGGDGKKVVVEKSYSQGRRLSWGKGKGGRRFYRIHCIL